MFQSVLHPDAAHAQKLKTGAWASAGLHLAALAIAVGLSSQARKANPEPTPALRFFSARASAGPRGAPTVSLAPAHPAAQAPRKPSAHHSRLATPAPQAALQALVADPVALDTGPGDKGTGPPAVGGEDGDPGMGPGEAKGSGTEEVLKMQTGMKPPVLLGGADITYTREAAEARVEGTLIAQCVITREGRTEGCRIIKGLPHMNEAAIAALQTRRYQPMYFQGAPVNISYVFNVRLQLPR